MSLTDHDLQKIGNIFDEKIRAQADVQAARCAAHTEKTAEHHETLYGSAGADGLDKEVSQIKVYVRIGNFISAAAFVAILGLILKQIFINLI